MPIVEFEIPPGRRLLINVRRESTLLMVDQALTLSYDREGRMTGAWIQGRKDPTTWGPLGPLATELLPS